MSDASNGSRAGWVCYDAECPVCVRWAARFRLALERSGYALVPLQSPAVRRSLNLPEAELLAEMRLVTRDGVVLGGADAILHLAGSIGWTWPLRLLARVPGARPLLRRAYRRFAASRACASGACRARSGPSAAPGWGAWLPLLAATMTALAIGPFLPAWGFMWVLAFAIFAGCKWLTFRTSFANRARPNPARAAGYLLAWPGMDAEAFLWPEASPARPRTGEWLFALAKFLFGAALVWLIARRFAGEPLLAGWVGMVGFVFVLHFGLFQLLSLAWRRAGVNAEPLMRAPVRSKSPAEFWGARWNAGFHELAKEFLFRPLQRRLGVRAATMIVFLVSGLIHDLVISVPAGAGYGLPTLYFVTQGATVLAGHSRWARRCGVGRNGWGRLFTVAVTAGPAGWLFPPPFVLNVMIPFLRTIGAL